MIGRKWGAGERLQTIELARAANIEHFVFNSVFHPQMREMPHHARKLLVEEDLITSGMAFNIVQPAMLMQNIVGFWKKICTDGTFPALSAPDKKFALVDVEDLGEAIANILMDKSLRNATYELAGADMLTYQEMAALISEELNRPIQLETLDENGRRRISQSQNWTPYATETFLTMLQHYDAHGFPGGNKLVLSSILRREPNSYRKFIQRLITS
ncbi:MAG: NmrA family NAD(P)-binding protein [Desulfopila sp.]